MLIKTFKIRIKMKIKANKNKERGLIWPLNTF